MKNSPNKDDVKGIVLHLEKMAQFDGKGMRTVVFLKGCPMRCLWCSTPESQRMAPQLGFDATKCTACHQCVEVCPNGAILPGPDGGPVQTDAELCDQCFQCVAVCPAHARKAYGRETDSRTVLAEIEKDDLFFFHSGGGVTISGGEPLIQADFVYAILSDCKAHGIHAAIETSGHIPWENFEKVLSLIDAVLIDIKVYDADRHKELTAHDNRQILSNIKKIDEADVPIELYIRIPLVPGINDSDENLSATAAFCKTLNKFKELHILPYHRMGVDVYRFLNMDYTLENVPTPDIEMIEAKIAKLRKQGINVKLGG